MLKQAVGPQRHFRFNDFFTKALPRSIKAKMEAGGFACEAYF